MKKNNPVPEKVQYSTHDRKWMIIHRRILLGVALATLVIEVLTAVFLNFSGMLATDSWEYVSRYILFPSICIGVIVIFVCIATCGEKAGTRAARYIVSLGFTGICLVLYVAHGYLSSMYAPLMASIVMTTIYGDYLLTTLGFGVSLGGMFAGKLIRMNETALSTIMNGPELMLDFHFAVVMLAGFYLVSLGIISFERHKRKEELEKERARLELQMELMIDPLTGLNNRKALRAALETLPEVKLPCFFVMGDLNSFKVLNDTHGHPAGDRCLKYFAGVLSRRCSPHQVFRYGGDEFCVLFAGESEERVSSVCEAIREEMQEGSGREVGIFFTCSFGIAEFVPGMHADELITQADIALYQAKTFMDHICVYEEKRLPTARRG